MTDASGVVAAKAAQVAALLKEHDPLQVHPAYFDAVSSFSPQIGVVRKDVFLTALSDCGIDVSSPVVREVVDFCADGTSVLYQQFFADIQAGSYSLDQLQPPSGVQRSDLAVPPIPVAPVPNNKTAGSDDFKVKEQLAKARVELTEMR